MPKRNSPGCHCCATGTLIQPVTGCGGHAIPDGLASVSLFLSGVLQATATIVSGQATFTGIAAGTYTTTAQGAGAAAGRWTSASSGSITVGSGTTTAPTLGLTTADAGFVCGPTDCAVPWKTTLTATFRDGEGTLQTEAVTYSAGTYSGCTTFVRGGGQNPTIHGCVPAAVTTPLFLSISIAGLALASLQLTLGAVVCTTATNIVTDSNCTVTANHTNTDALDGGTCWPVSLTFAASGSVVQFPGGTPGAFNLLVDDFVNVTE